jgi:hypothetical protein
MAGSAAKKNSVVIQGEVEVMFVIVKCLDRLREIKPVAPIALMNYRTASNRVRGE